MTDPSPADVRRSLCTLLGWRFTPHLAGYFARSPEGLELDVGPGLSACVPDPAADLNTMAAVEAVLRGRGLAAAYLWHLVQIVNGRRPDGGAADTREDRENLSLFDAVTAPAAVRALAADRAIRAAEGKS